MLYNNCYIDNFYISENDIRNYIIDYKLYKYINEINLKEIDNGKEEIIILNQNLQFKFTTTLNQEQYKNDNNITLDLSQCEYDLKINNSIPLNDPLYILQIIYEEEGIKIPKVEYEVFYNFNNGTDLIKLNLAPCKGSKVLISIHVELNDSLEVHDIKSNYYKDICSKATSEMRTDISLSDRIQEFIKYNLFICEENCELIDYNYTNKKVKCLCDIKLEKTENYEIKFNKVYYINNFTPVLNILNANILKCYKVVLNIKNLKENYGFFIMTFIILFYFITLLIFGLCSYNNLKKEIANIHFALKFSETPEDNNKIIIFKNDKDKKENKKEDKIIRKQSKKETKRNKNKKKTKETNNQKEKKNNQLEIKNNKERKTVFDSKTMDNNKINSNQKMKGMDLLEMGLFENIKNTINNNINYKNILKLKDFEINSLDYEEAVTLDKRNYFEYYISLLKNNHPLTFSFAPFVDYNSFIIRIFLFFFSFSSDLTINAFFLMIILCIKYMKIKMNSTLNINFPKLFIQQ